jgi:hypothetical protein
MNTFPHLSGVCKKHVIPSTVCIISPLPTDADFQLGVDYLLAKDVILNNDDILCFKSFLGNCCVLFDGEKCKLLTVKTKKSPGFENHWSSQPQDSIVYNHHSKVDVYKECLKIKSDILQRGVFGIFTTCENGVNILYKIVVDYDDTKDIATRDPERDIDEEIKNSLKYNHFIFSLQ